MRVIERIFEERNNSYSGPQTPNSGGFESYSFQDWLAGVNFNGYSFFEEMPNLFLEIFRKLSGLYRNLYPDLAVTHTQSVCLL